MPKKTHKNRTVPKNWKSIPLLNTDYNIIAKSLALHL